MNTNQPTRVFISYSHDSSQNDDAVLKLANRLRGDGIDCMIDRYVPAPREGWQRWMQSRIEWADFVLLFCTTEYCRRFRGHVEKNLGRGVNWEAQIITQLLYEKTFNEQIIPLLPDGEEEQSVPVPLRAYTVYHYPSDYSKLYRHLTQQPEILIPAVGRVRAMPPLKTLSQGTAESRRADSYKYDVFLLYHYNDKLAVDQLSNRLSAGGITAWTGINPLIGESLPRDTREALMSSRNCVVILGPSGDRPWQNEELRELLWRRVSRSDEDFKAIPVLLPGAERPSQSSLPGYLTSSPWVEFRFRLEDDAAFSELRREIAGVEPVGGGLFHPTANPYRGLQAFDVDDGRFFFGREAQTQWLLEKLRISFGSRKETRFLAILGPSGSGKSSLARAGLLSALKRGEIGH
ncbi:MAG TPA: TIR domain-containing protein, partial [Ktedonobacteraceae bacterium]|nr:TIR domain-containing protein [Ktedonobacteraceae bacterium]